MLGLLLGGGRGLLGGPLAIFGGIFAIFALCKCMSCMKCRLRDCACVKTFLRLIGHDPFDDFELMVLVHEALFDRKDGKLTTVVQITAGSHSVKTDPNSNGIFQQPLHITVEQGTEHIVMELLDNHGRVLAVSSVEVMDHILDSAELQPETMYTMKVKGKGIHNPRLKLTMVVSSEDDEEKGLMGGVGLASDVDILVRQQLKKAKAESAAHGDHSELEVLKQACAGPLELFEGLGKTHAVYVAVVGPPTSRRWMLGIWKDQRDFEAKKHGIMEIDLLKIQSVQADPSRHHVFVVNCFDESRVRKSLTFRRMDRARDVWVEILHLVVVKAREGGKRSKTVRGEPGAGGRSGRKTTRA